MKNSGIDYNKFKDFPKSYDYENIEKKIGKIWEENEIYKFSLDAGKNPPRKIIFSIDTPPPYVSSAHLHVGHVMSYSQAEFIVRYKRMRGFNVFYPMGFDDNGLPTERYVEKKYKVNKAKITREEFIELCLKETKIGIETYKNLWKSAGISVDYSLSYSTIDDRCRRAAQKSFIELFNKNLIQRRNDPILWCPHCRTSLAQADIAIEEKNGTLYDIEFTSSQGEGLIISTTRPELLGACVAIYANPEDKRYISLKGQEVIVPVYNKSVPVRYDESVDVDYGTGLMMVCTWGDMEDVRKWKEHKLNTAIIIDTAGRLTQPSGTYAGLNTTEAKKRIVEDLRSLSLIKGEKSVIQNVGIHDRCETPVEFIQAYQWFIKILEERDKFLRASEEMNWHPAFMKERYVEWVNNLRWDWNISRQRFYGVPFPVWYCKGCEEVILAGEKELPVDPLVSNPSVSSCPKCGGTVFEPEKDVMDTWMTSSLTPLINAGWADPERSGNKKFMNMVYPMSMRPQAQEIIRTWLFYTVVKSVYHTGQIPFKEVMISGWGLDKNGKKMSKSLGNFVEPEGIITRYSADALRYWSARANLGQDLRFNEEDTANGRRLLIKIWNSARFLITNVDNGFNPHEKDLAALGLGAVDRWVVSEFERTLKSCEDYMESFEYASALKTLTDYFYNIYCDNYLEIIKNVFWDDDEKSLVRRNKVLNVMYFISCNLLKTFAPFFPFITEELFLSFYRYFEGGESIHLSVWPEYRKELEDDNSVKIVEILLDILSASRKLRTNLNLHQNHKIDKLLIKAMNKDYAEIINGLGDDIKSAARVKRIVFSDEAYFSTANEDIYIGLTK